MDFQGSPLRVTVRMGRFLTDILKAFFQPNYLKSVPGTLALAIAISLATFHTGKASAQSTLANGVDPNNLGKGDWIWLMSSSLSRLGYTNTQQLINYETNMGMQWITVKCADGTNVYSQYNSNLVAQAHATGLKIFPYAYIYGLNTNETALESAIAVNAMRLGGDGFIIAAEAEFESSTNNQALAVQYCQAIRAAFPNYFLAHNPYYQISYHTNFPYLTFGLYVDAAMPQAFWPRYGMTPTAMVAAVDSEWSAWQNGLTGTNRNAIKPVIMAGETINLGGSYQTVTSATINEFVNALKTDTAPATPGGYGGASFYEVQDRNADMDSAVSAALIGGPLAPKFTQLRVSTNGAVQFNLNGRYGTKYEIDFSTNALGWSALTNFVNSNGVFQFTDTAFSSHKNIGYYRAKLLTN